MLYIRQDPTVPYVKRRSEKTMVDVQKNVKVVHLNVDAGYLSYIKEVDGKIVVKSIPLYDGDQ